MELLIAGLVLAVVYAACKAQAAEQAATAASITGLPPNTAIAATGATGTPSPASAMGAPGAAGSFQVKLDTNSTFPTNAAGDYTTTEVYPGNNGIPLPLVPGGADAGFNSMPATTKQLSTATKPGRVSAGNFNIASGVPYRL